jgi:pyruvate/2-oxoacid:ferredoxin oxidoreductase alpha subunit
MRNQESSIQYMRGNQAAAEAARLARIEFMGAYPIPPSSEIMEHIRTFIEEGQLKAGFIEADGEKSAQMACYAAAFSGCRTLNATSSQGLLFMHEANHMIAGSFLPMLLVVGNRSCFAPHGMEADHTDSISQRDTGWLQLYCETVQEVFDDVIQGYKIIQNPDVMLPMFVCQDGYLLTHSMGHIACPTQEEVDAFLPPYQPGETDYVKPGGLPLATSLGVMDQWFTEFKYQQWMKEGNALQVIEDVDAEFGRHFGRSYGGLLEAYRVDDAEVVMIGMGSVVATIRFTVDIMRSAGKKVGMVKIRAFRPFPKDKLAQVIAGSSSKMIVVAEKTFYGAVFDEVRSALYGLDNAPGILGFGVGLNGRNVDPYNIIDLFEQGFKNIGNKNIPSRSQIYFVRKKN